MKYISNTGETVENGRAFIEKLEAARINARWGVLHIEHDEKKVVFNILNELREKIKGKS